MNNQLEQLVSYQDAAVVSKEIIKKQTGTITVFAFDAEQGLSEHTAPFDAFVNIVEGEALITIDQVEHQLSAGDFIILPANKPHAVTAIQRFKMLLVMIKE